MNNNHDNKSDTSLNEKISIRIGSASFTATLEDTATAKPFRAQWPATATMDRHARHKKYHHLPGSLFTDAYHPRNDSVRRPDAEQGG